MLTGAGGVLLQHANLVLQEVERAEKALRELSSDQRGTVRLGAGATTLIYRLPDCLSQFRQAFPEVEVSIETGTTEFMVQRLHALRLDLALVMLPVTARGLRITPAGKDDLAVVLPRSHPLARKPMLEPEMLAKLSFILYEKRTAMQEVVDQWFGAMRVLPRVTMELENIEAIKSLVRNGFGAAVLPRSAVQAGTRGETLRALDVRGYPISRQLALASLDTQGLPRPIRTMGRMIVDCLRSQQQ
jgi:LysR family transcriptional activator of glutamate synthase operon